MSSENIKKDEYESMLVMMKASSVGKYISITGHNWLKHVSALNQFILMTI